MKTKKVLIIFIVILATILGGVAGYFFTSQKNHNDLSETNNTNITDTNSESNKAIKVAPNDNETKSEEESENIDPNLINYKFKYIDADIDYDNTKWTVKEEITKGYSTYFPQQDEEKETERVNYIFTDLSGNKLSINQLIPFGDGCPSPKKYEPEYDTKISDRLYFRDYTRYLEQFKQENRVERYYFMYSEEIVDKQDLFNYNICGELDDGSYYTSYFSSFISFGVTDSFIDDLNSGNLTDPNSVIFTIEYDGENIEEASKIVATLEDDLKKYIELYQSAEVLPDGLNSSIIHPKEWEIINNNNGELKFKTLDNNILTINYSKNKKDNIVVFDESRYSLDFASSASSLGEEGYPDNYSIYNIRADDLTQISGLSYYKNLESSRDFPYTLAQHSLIENGETYYFDIALTGEDLYNSSDIYYLETLVMRSFYPKLYK